MIFSGDHKEGSIAFRNNSDLFADEITVTDAMVGLVHYPHNTIDINKLICTLIGGDSVNLRGNDVHIKTLKVRGSKAWLSYKNYHQDVVQAYAVKDDGFSVDVDGIIRNVYIENVDIDVRGFEHQVFMLTDSGFDNWHIGTKSLKIRCDYTYWFSANTLSNSVLGNLDNVDIAYHGEGLFKKPLVRIGDGIKGSKHCIHSSNHRTSNVMIIGCGNNNIVPDTVGQY